MRILVVSHAAATFEESKGGADVLALRHAAFLSEEFADVGYVGISHPTDTKDVGYFPVRDTDLLDYDRLGPRGASFGYLLNHFVRAAKAALKANDECGRFHPDVIITHTSTATIILKTFHPRKPLIYQIHDGLFVHRTVKGRAERAVRFLMNDLLERAAVRRANHVLCVSSSIHVQLLRAGTPADKLSVVPFLPASIDARSATARDSSTSILPSVSPFVLSVGQQSGRKRFDLLIEAMPFVKTPLHLVLVGDGPLWRHYAELVNRLGLTSRVHLLRKVSDAELADFYAHAAAFFLISENEGFPITLGEAVSYGCRSVLICPNIESTTEYPAELAQLVRRVPPAPEIAELMDSAYRASQVQPVVGQTPRTDSPRSEVAENPRQSLKSLYNDVFRRILPPADFSGFSSPRN